MLTELPRGQDSPSDDPPRHSALAGLRIAVLAAIITVIELGMAQSNADAEPPSVPIAQQKESELCEKIVRQLMNAIHQEERENIMRNTTKQIRKEILEKLIAQFDDEEWQNRDRAYQNACYVRDAMQKHEENDAFMNICAKFLQPPYSVEVRLTTQRLQALVPAAKVQESTDRFIFDPLSLIPLPLRPHIIALLQRQKR